jgi:predicted ribosome quality control (RQC) complex YloA/Tae2 family protein
VDLLVLPRVARALEHRLLQGILADFRQETPHRFRLGFETPDGARRSLAISLRPEGPWVGWPARTAPRIHVRPSAFAASTARTLQGAVVVGIRHVAPDRVIVLTFAEGHRLVLELATHGANLVVLDPSGAVVLVALHPRSAADRLHLGEAWSPPRVPGAYLVPFGATAAAIDDAILTAQLRGERRIDALRRHVFGIGASAADLIERECVLTGASAGEVLHRRVGAIEAEALDPVVEAPREPLVEAESGRLDPSSFRLLPWPPSAPPPGCRH